MILENPNFHGIKGRSGRKSKREECEFWELVKLSKWELVRLGKRFKALGYDKAQEKDPRLYRFWLEACLAIVLKSMPTPKSQEPADADAPETLPFLIEAYAPVARN